MSIDAAPETGLAGDEARLDGVAVRTDSASVAAFRLACLDDGAADDVPASYPFCWLASPLTRPTLARMIGKGAFPVHEAQSFAYERPLALDSDYRLDFTFRRTSGPDRLTVAASITPAGGAEPCASFETVLRLVPGGRTP